MVVILLFEYIKIDRDKSTISRHIKKYIYRKSELQRDSFVAKFATNATDGKTY